MNAKTLFTGLAIVPGLLLAAAPIADAAKTDVVFIGGTGSGMKLTEIFGTGGSPTGITGPFVAHPDQLEVPIYDGAPWANPQSSVPFVAEFVAKTDDPTVVVGLSKGAQVAHGVEAQDTRTDTSYVVIGDPDSDGGVSRAFGISPPQTVKTHDWTEVVAEYDGVGDFPDRPLNLLADANALAGWVYIHPNYGVGGDIDPLTHLDTAQITTTRNPNGTTFTREFIPTKDLPLTQPLRNLGLNTTGLDKALRPAIDAGYSRNDKTVRPAPQTGTKSVTKAPSTDTAAGKKASTKKSPAHRASTAAKHRKVA